MFALHFLAFNVRHLTSFEKFLKGDVPRLLYKLHAETRWLTYFLVLKMLVLRAQKELGLHISPDFEAIPFFSPRR